VGSAVWSAILATAWLLVLNQLGNEHKTFDQQVIYYWKESRSDLERKRLCVKDSDFNSQYWQLSVTIGAALIGQWNLLTSVG